MSASGMATPPRAPPRTAATALTAWGTMVSCPSITSAIGSLYDPFRSGAAASHHRNPRRYLEKLPPDHSHSLAFAAEEFQVWSSSATGIEAHPAVLTDASRASR